jgi:hypothetical protein
MKFKTLLLLGLFALLPLASDAQVYNQWPAQASSFRSAIAAATPAVVTVKSGTGVVTNISCFNILATPVYVKLYDVSGTITLGTTAATYEFMCPGNTAGAGFVTALTWAVTFANSIKYAVTGAISLTDNTSISASSVIVNIGFN